MTVICKTITEWKKYKSKIANDRSLGLVPTMGNFHQGHQNLFEASIKENDITVVSSFVNPTQFNQAADFEHYPKTFDADLQMLEGIGVDVLFFPTYQDMYPDNYRYVISENTESRAMEGQYRPAHFDGVLTIVMKLLCLIQPHKAYFGEKDYQQLKLVKDLVDVFFLETEIIACPTTRNEAGLALSSRNNRLSATALKKASEFSAAMKKASSAEEALTTLVKKDFKVDYIEEHYGRRFGAVWLEGIRLIDNIKLNTGEQS